LPGADLSDQSALARQARWLEDYAPRVRIRERGQVAAIGDGIAWITGLPSARMDDVLQFDDGSRGMVLDLNEERIGAVLLHASDGLTAGTRVRRAGYRLSVPVGEALLGRVIDPLGNPLDDGSPPDTRARRPLEAPSPPIAARDFVHEPLYTGTKIIDSLVPIGRGQRQLLLGDDGLGRSSLAIDAVINQRDRGIQCVYVLIGQKRSTTVSTIETLRECGAMTYTTIVVAEASSLPGLQHLAPYAGCALAEHWMLQGRHTLVVYDDLTRHAETYRALSLLLRRPPGREAFPGDIFSVHARLLERATCLNAAHGGGSMTALPIIETQEGEIASYIPTNLISITDGQVYLDRDLFSGGFRPAIDIAKSVSRIGGAAQHPRIKQEAGRMKLDYLQYLELEVFTRFGARLESSMEAAIARGRVLREILKQERLHPLHEEFQLAWMIAFNDGLFTGLPEEHVAEQLDNLESRMTRHTLTLDSSREAWSRAVAEWLPNRRPPEATSERSDSE
jgi:F-type H+-transporting ATPase subunit alpha